MYLDIPNLQTVDLPSSFQKVRSKSISSITNLDYILFIDISIQLGHILPLFYQDILSLDQAVASIILPKWSFNENDYTVFDFSRFTQVESIEIGDDSFESVQTFKIDGLNQLHTIKIGINSFTQSKNSNGSDTSKSFHILNCESLESIQIGEYSFNDFAGEFELKNLPQLQSIQIGTIGSISYNFFVSSFVIRSTELILNIIMIRSSKFTIHYIR